MEVGHGGCSAIGKKNREIVNIKSISRLCQSRFGAPLIRRNGFTIPSACICIYVCIYICTSMYAL
jgi:hypothetical protein